MRSETNFDNLVLITDTSVTSGPATLTTSGQLTIPVYSGGGAALGTALTVSTAGSQSDGFAAGNGIRVTPVNVSLTSGTATIRVLAANAVAGSLQFYAFAFSPASSTAQVNLVDDASNTVLVNVAVGVTGQSSAVMLVFTGTSWLPVTYTSTYFIN